MKRTWLFLWMLGWIEQKKEILQLEELCRDVTRPTGNWQIHSRMSNIRKAAEVSEKDHQIIANLIVKKLMLLIYWYYQMEQFDSDIYLCNRNVR